MEKQSALFAAPTEFERLHVRRMDGRTLIVGSYIVRDKKDRRLLYQNAVGLDMRPGPGVDVVHDLWNSRRLKNWDSSSMLNACQCLSTADGCGLWRRTLKK